MAEHVGDTERKNRSLLMSLFPRQVSVHSTRCQVWEGARVPCPHLPAPLLHPRLSYSSQDSLPLSLSLWSLIEMLSLLRPLLPWVPPHSFLHSHIRASLNLATTLGSSQNVGVPWSLPPCLCDPFHFCCVCFHVLSLCSRLLGALPISLGHSQVPLLFKK